MSAKPSVSHGNPAVTHLLAVMSWTQWSRSCNFWRNDTGNETCNLLTPSEYKDSLCRLLDESNQGNGGRHGYFAMVSMRANQRYVTWVKDPNGHKTTKAFTSLIATGIPGKEHGSTRSQTSAMQGWTNLTAGWLRWDRCGSMDPKVKTSTRNYIQGELQDELQQEARTAFRPRGQFDLWAELQPDVPNVLASAHDVSSNILWNEYGNAEFAMWVVKDAKGRKDRIGLYQSLPAREMHELGNRPDLAVLNKHLLELWLSGKSLDEKHFGTLARLRVWQGHYLDAVGIVKGVVKGELVRLTGAVAGIAGNMVELTVGSAGDIAVGGMGCSRRGRRGDHMGQYLQSRTSRRAARWESQAAWRGLQGA
ncbi:uncharacterized protein BXZ73DRAFT_74085 [Epithele typhae]|uniref:uncharacterized protein n=1 Tax=Epithele typhae TaxID=378194 RepID=UPI002007F454|nr:uncharacterized protein BXZ73DRAFT_74085 [Epithele typhae]KAH9943022.1 hypothetical protein BXZ73DRAFT_74085 [Epithele typhae]